MIPNNQINICPVPCFPEFLAAHRPLLEEIFNQSISPEDRGEILLEDFALDVFAEVYSSTH